MPLIFETVEILRISNKKFWRLIFLLELPRTQGVLRRLKKALVLDEGPFSS